MMASRCYEMSAEPNKLGCTSCHDAHRHPTPTEKAGHYRQRCLKCHTESSCGLPVAVRHERNKDDSCIACHMPRISSEVSHTAITDHRVPRRPEQAPAPPERRFTAGPDDLTPFHAHLLEANDPEVQRNLGLAVLGMLDRGPPREALRLYADKALPLLEAALRRDPKDLPVLEAKANCLWIMQRPREALADYEAALAAHPESEPALFGAGNVALELNLLDKAEEHLAAAVRANPWNWSHQQRLAVARFRRGAWDDAVAAGRAALRIEPANGATRSLLVQTYLARGDRAQAEAEYEILQRITSESRRDNLRLWYEEQLRRWR
jgi:tetratricopeptide (TPR) repeat protein